MPTVRAQAEYAVALVVRTEQSALAGYGLNSLRTRQHEQRSPVLAAAC